MNHMNRIESKFLRKIKLATVFAICLLSSATSIANAASYPDHLVNGDFSYPAVVNQSGGYIDPINGMWNPIGVGDGTTSWSKIDGWDFEQFRWMSNQQYTSWGNTYVPAHTVQYFRYGNAELVAHSPGGVIYQDISTKPGAVYYWSLGHWSVSADHIDTMSVNIGTPTAQTRQNAYRINSDGSRTFVGTSITSDVHSYKTAMHYEGTYEIPENQTVTRFTFESIDGVNDRVGNAVREIEFSVAYPLHYDTNGGTGTFPEPHKDSNGVYRNYQVAKEPVTLDSTVPSRPGYTFLGWSFNVYSPVSSSQYDEVAGNLIGGTFDMPDSETTVHAVWAKNPTVTFDANTKSTLKMTLPSSQSVPFGGKASKPTSWTADSNAIIDGYSFGGWMTAASGSTAYDFNATSVYEDTTIYARWTANRYTITFDGNGSTSGQMPKQDMKYGLSQTLPEKNFTKTGYAFTGWNTAKDGSGKSYANQAIVNNLTSVDGGNITLYAQWSQNTYTVRYSSGAADATGNVQDQTVTYGDEFTARDNGFSRTGYTFVKWKVTSGQSGSQIECLPGDTLRDLTDKGGGVVTLTAQWRANAYTVQFNPNGGTGNMSPIDMEYGETRNLTANSFKRAGYDFTGWRLGDKDSGDAYADRAEISNLTADDNDSVTFYAQWKAHKYHIAFDKNKGDATGTTAPLDASFDVEATLTVNGFSSPSASFSGWNTKPDGSGNSYPNRAKVKNLTADDGATVTLYAQWSTNSYTVTFIDGHDGKTISTAKVTYGGSAQLPTKPHHRGYKGTNWNGTYTGITSNSTVTLEYEPISYEIRFDGNGATDGHIPNQSATYDTESSFTRNAYSRTGYTFAGWRLGNKENGDKYGNGSSFSNLSDIDGSTVTMYAQWTPNAYTVRYDSNGGTGDMPDQQMEYDSRYQLSANAFSKPGYTFTGWKRDDRDSGRQYRNRESVTNLLSANGSSTTMYAQWKANEYTVTFIDGVNGKTIGASTARYGKTATAPTAPAHMGMTFTGWDADYSSITSDTKITAIYRNNSYTIAFDGNSGSVSGVTQSMQMEYGTAKRLNANGFSRNGYTFVCWNTKADGTGTEYFDRQQVINLTDKDAATVTLYAVWKINRHTVTFIDGQDGSAISRVEVDHGSPADAPSFPSHTGYVPTGWKGSFSNVTTDTVITAEYRPISYTIAFRTNSDDSTGATASMHMKYGQAEYLTRNGFKRRGYRFSGWNANADGTGKSYTDAEGILNLTDRDGSTVELFAVWTELGSTHIAYKTEDDGKTYGNAIDLHGEDLNPEIGEAKGSTATPTTGYAFAGWYDENGKKVSDEKTFVPEKPRNGRWANATYTARFSRIELTVSFVGKDGASISEQKVMYGDAADAPDAPHIDGYEFAGWDKTFDSVTEDMTVTALYRELPKEEKRNPLPAEQPEKREEKLDVEDELMQTGIDISYIAIVISIAIVTSFAIYRHLIRNRN